MMKLILIFISTMFITQVMVGQDFQIVEVESNQVLNITAGQSWEIVGNWEGLHHLVPEVVKSTEVSGEGINATWQIHLINGTTITEKMVYYDESERTMSYIMTETPMPIEDYLAVIKVEPYGISKSLISFFTSCNTSDENYEQILNSFKGFQETYLSNIEKQLK